MQSSQNAQFHPPPKNLEWKGTTSNGPTLIQSMSRIDPKLKNGDQTKRGPANWASNTFDRMGLFMMGPPENMLCPDGSKNGEAFPGCDTSPGLSALPRKIIPASVKGKKAFAKGFSPKSNISNANNPLSKILSAKLTSLSANHVSPPSHKTYGSPNSIFEFTTLTLVPERVDL